MGLWGWGADAEKIGDIDAKNDPEEPPEFKRLYRVKLDQRASMTVTARTSSILGRRDYSGELTQPGGRWVWFDPERVADKILDPALVPLIEQWVGEIIRLDKEWLGSGRDVYIDNRGGVWRRALKA
jgi:hypothetical protein